MPRKETTLAVRLPEELAAQLERLAQETGRSKNDYARQAIIEFLEDRADYEQVAEIYEREKDEPRVTLEEVKRELGLED